MLNEKQKRFCEEYIVDLNASKAALRAGYSEKTAGSTGSENLKKPEIQSYISELQNKRAERVEVTQDEVLSELKNFAFADITQTLLLTTEEVMNLPVEVRRMITKYKHTTRSFKNEDGQMVKEDVLELWFVDKTKAFEMINRHIGFYGVDNKQRTPQLTPTEREETFAKLKAKILK